MKHEIQIRVDPMRNFAEIHAVDVFGVSSDSCGAQQGLEYHLIVKSHPQNEDAQRFLQPGHTFDKEVGMYGQVSEFGRCAVINSRLAKAEQLFLAYFFSISRLYSRVKLEQTDNNIVFFANPHDYEENPERVRRMQRRSSIINS